MQIPNWTMLLELKSAEEIVDAHRSQVLNYLKATELQLAIILNFGKEMLEYEKTRSVTIK
ncbi:MAG TPA: GxxExxY protein [Candidatus Brocadiaceae bacterium]